MCSERVVKIGSVSHNACSWFGTLEARSHAGLFFVGLKSVKNVVELPLQSSK